jgi:hypothetical protein
MTTVKVQQVTSIRGDSFLNIDEEYGYIDAWGSLYKTPILVLLPKEDDTNGNEVHFIVCDSGIGGIKAFMEDRQLTFDYHRVFLLTKNGLVEQKKEDLE